MPPRRSARAASAKVETKAAPTKPAAKPLARTRSNPAKRPASPDTTLPPPSKRSRSSRTLTNGSIDVPKTKKVIAEKLKVKAIPKRVVPQPRRIVPPKPHFNVVPSPPEHLRPAPQLFVWGAGNFGQFGMGVDSLGELDKPKPNRWIESKIQEGVFGGEGAGLEAVAAGGLHTLFIDENGVVWSCGVNDDGALGRITTDVPNPDKEGEFLDIDTLTAQPHRLQSLADEEFRAVRIAAGDTISAAISDKGELRVWGSFRGVEGILGFSSGQRHQWLPVPILDLKSKPTDPEKFTAVAAGNNHLLVLTTHGGLYTWGAGEQGQLGRKVMERRKIHGTVPEKIVLGNRNHKAVVVGAGSYSSFAVDDKGEVWAWGLNSMGQTGTGFTSASTDGEVQLPKKVVGLGQKELGGDEKVVEIAGGEHHTLFLTSAGRVFSCGRMDGGQLGLADDDKALKDRKFPDMLEIPSEITFPDSDDPIVHISTGIHNNLAVTKGGAMYAWGAGPQGELGVGDETEVRTPRVVVRKEGGKFFTIAASCGGQHSLGLLRKKT